MENHPSRGVSALVRTFLDPAMVVVMVCQMLLGAGLAVALVLKVYMLVFTDHVCVADSAALGNAIRCTPSLMIVAHVLLLVAGLRFAVLLFAPRASQMHEALLLALVGVFLLFLSGPDLAQGSWFMPLIVLSLFAPIGCVYAAMRLWSGERRRD